MVQPRKHTKAEPHSRRGRPTARRAEEIEASIRSAALDTFLEVGFEAANMEVIAARAPVAKGTLYARYESKQKLFRAVMEAELERMSLEAGANDHLLPLELAARLRYHARTLIETNREPRFRAFATLIESAFRTFPELEVDWQELGTDRFLRFLAEDIGRTNDAHGSTHEDRLFYANLFLHSITGYQGLAASRFERSELELTIFVDAVIDTIILAIRAKQQ